MENYYVKSLNFLKEAKDSIERAKISKDIPELKRNILSFLNAAKHCLFPLKRYKNILKGYDIWEQEYLQILNNPVAEYFCKSRNSMTKEGQDIIDAEMNLAGLGFGYIGVNNKSIQITSEGYFIEDGEILNTEDYLHGSYSVEIKWNFNKLPVELEREHPIILMNKYVDMLDLIIKNFNKRFEIISLDSENFEPKGRGK